ncbi:hypothetical protein LSAT2_023149 [Lamellibrachia satsuma]|nr:hypothetical protein LSAT2_023149 [Lamellibrachia satsuma]
MTTFRVLLGVRRLQGDESVCYKEDGGRFGVERTIKLNVNCSYKLQLTVRSSQQLQDLNVNGCQLQYDKRSSQTGDDVVYEAAWNTAGLVQTSAGKRLDVPFLVQLQDLPTLKLSLQCKLYAESEKSHARWGTPLSHVEYECRVPQNGTYVDVVKETISTNPNLVNKVEVVPGMSDPHAVLIKQSRNGARNE